MSKPLVIISFANNIDRPLPNLTEEKEHVVKSVEDRKTTNNFECAVASTREEINLLLKNDVNRENLILFSFSGHADHDILFTEKESTASDGVARLLSECRNLKLIILNGCSTEGQVKIIYNAFAIRQFTPPVIIATSAGVGDKTAKEFGSSFFEQVFVFNRTIYTAFNVSIALVKTNVEAVNLRIDESSVRSFLIESSKGNWGLYVPDDKNKKEYASFTISRSLNSNSTYKPNASLLRSIIRKLKDYNRNINERFEKDARIVSNTNHYIDDILASFPYPIARRIARLMSSESRNDLDTAIFYNKPDFHRLGELLRTYQTTIDIVLSIVQAELYLLFIGKKITIDETALLKIRGYYYKSKEARRYTRTEYVEIWLRVLGDHHQHLFVSELSSLTVPQSNFFSLGKFFEDLFSQYPKMSNEEASGVVELTEKKLAKVLEIIAFIVNYDLTSIENIYVSSRRRKSPHIKYEHQLYKHQNGGKEPRKIEETLETYLDNSCVILRKKNDIQIDNYLNLSPFIVDEIITIIGADVSNLIAFCSMSPDPASEDEAKRYVYSYRYLIFNGGTEENLMKFELTNLDSNEGSYQNKAYVEIEKEWNTYLNYLENNNE